MADVKITGDISKKLNDLSKKLDNMSQPFRDIADYELSQTRLRYTKEVDPENKKWAIPFTIRRDGSGGRNTNFNNPWGYVEKSNYHAAPPGYHFFDKARGDKIMRDTGTLFASLGRAFGKDYAIVGTNISYGKENQEGTNGKKARPFLGINKKTYDNVKKVVTFYLKGIK
jgi:phage gpG-like protein